MSSFKVDENLPVEIAALLREHGHEAATAYDQQLAGNPDQELAAICRSEMRALVTLDLDFADVRTYPPEEYPGIIVLRATMQQKPHLLAMFERAIPLLDREPIAGCLWIVDETSVRVRSGGPEEG